MNCTLQRAEIGEQGAFGTMLDDQGNAICLDLERTYLQADGSWAPKIPIGTWTFKRYMSPHLGYEVFMCSDIPGHDFIEIHIANEESQLDGCIALGTLRQGAEILESKLAFQKFMALQANVNEMQLSVSNG